MESIAAPPLAEVLADIPDCRAARGKRHGLLPILLLVCMATRCGARSPTAIAAWGKDYGPPWLRRLGFTKDYGPSQSTLCRLVQRVAYAAIEAALRQWAERVMAQAAMGELGGVALDGKTLRRAHDRTNGKAPLHMVSAWASGSGLVLGPLVVDDKSNELTAIPALLRLLDLAGSTVTIDAMGCQTAIAAQIVAQGGDSAPALKDNPPRCTPRWRTPSPTPAPRGSPTTPRPTTTTTRRSSRTTGARRPAAPGRSATPTSSPTSTRARGGPGCAPSAWSSASGGSARR